MKYLTRRLNARELLLIWLTTTVIGSSPLVVYGLVPAWDRLKQLRSEVAVKRVRFAEFSGNLQIGHQVDTIFNEIENDGSERELSDHLATGEFLRTLIGIQSKYATITMINTEPLSVRSDRTYKVYPVRLAFAGNLPDVIEFITSATHHRTVTGIESFSLRGVQGANMVECAIVLNMVRLQNSQADRRAGINKIGEGIGSGR